MGNDIILRKSATSSRTALANVPTAERRPSYLALPCLGRRRSAAKLPLLEHALAAPPNENRCSSPRQWANRATAHDGPVAYDAHLCVPRHEDRTRSGLREGVERVLEIR